MTRIFDHVLKYDRRSLIIRFHILKRLEIQTANIRILFPTYKTCLNFLCQPVCYKTLYFKNLYSIDLFVKYGNVKWHIPSFPARYSEQDEPSSNHGCLLFSSLTSS